MRHTKSYIKGHPNPQFTRSDFENLNGIWNFVFDDEDVGLKNKYYSKFPANPLQINVPYTYETKRSGIEDHKVHNVVWYNRTINYTPSKKDTYINFEGVDYYTRLYVNGVYVGEHKGGYTKFSFNITSYLRKGENSITLRVYDDLDAARIRGKQRWKPESFECFYVQTTGIWKTVWLEHKDPTHLDLVLMDPSYKYNNVAMEFRVAGDLENVELETIISYKDELISKERKAVTRPLFSQTFDITTDSATMKTHCWCHWDPCLYDVVFNIYKNGKLVDTVMSYFGVAEYTSKGNVVYVNRNQVFLKLVLDQGYLADAGLCYDEEDVIKDIKVMQDITLNGCRKHQKIECDLWYYYCDIMGFYLWQELPSFYEYRKSCVGEVIENWINILYDHHNHPCIMTDVVINESWGTMAIRDRKDQQALVNGLYYATKALERNRFVVSNDGWEHTISDLYTIHNYCSSYEELMLEFNLDPHNLDADNRIVHTGAKSPSCEGYKNADKPVILSEFAGIAFSKDKDKGWGYGNLVADEDAFIERFKGQIDAIYDSGLFAGYCITQTSDVEQEVNGLVDVNREYKVSKERLIDVLSKRY